MYQLDEVILKKDICHVERDIISRKVKWHLSPLVKIFKQNVHKKLTFTNNKRN